MRKKYFIACLFFLMLFLAVSVLVAKRLLVGFDYLTTILIQKNIPYYFYFPLSILSLIGSFEVMSVFLLLSLYWGRKQGLREKESGNARLVKLFLPFIGFFSNKARSFLEEKKNLAPSIFIFGIFGVAHIVEFASKKWVHHPGPPLEFFRYQLPFLFPTSELKPGFSFPSGHSMRMVFLFVILTYFISRHKKLSFATKVIFLILLFFLSFLMLFSRIALGEHWFSDVLGGALFGAAAAFLGIAVL